MLNLWLHMQNPHYRSYRAGKRNKMLTFDRRPIYHALTYITVPFLGPQQPRYIGLTLYYIEIWRMTLKNNRAPLLSIIKLYASFHHHMWIQTRVTVRKRLSWVLTSVTLTFDLWPWPFAWMSLLFFCCFSDWRMLAYKISTCEAQGWVNSIPELELWLNSNSNSGIGIGIEIGRI